MTHTLHRRGSREALATDWVVIAMAARHNTPPDAGERLRTFLSLAVGHGAVNWGDMAQGGRFDTPIETMLAGIDARSLLHAVFTEIDRVAALLDELRRTDLGLSVVVSGLLDTVEGVCRASGLDPARATVQLSLGTWGDDVRAPNGPLLEAVSLCGHGLVSAALVERTAAAVAAGRLTAEEGAVTLAGPCTCGVFNQVRAAALLERLASGRGTA